MTRSEKPVPPDVDPVPLISHCSGQPAHVLALFEDDRLDAGARQQFIGGGQTRGAGAHDNRFFLIGHNGERYKYISDKRRHFRALDASFGQCRAREPLPRVSAANLGLEHSRGFCTFGTNAYRRRGRFSASITRRCIRRTKLWKQLQLVGTSRVLTEATQSSRVRRYHSPKLCCSCGISEEARAPASSSAPA
jgi:hypothetical protein